MSLMNKKLGEVKFDDFVEAVKLQMDVRKDKEKIVEVFSDEENYNKTLRDICSEIYEEEVYKIGTLRGGVNGAIRKITQIAYNAKSVMRLSDMVEKGEIKKVTGMMIGGNDRELQSKNGNTFVKVFVPIITDEGELEEVTYITKIGGERYGKDTPWGSIADFYIDEDNYHNPTTGMTIPDNKVINYDNLMEVTGDLRDYLLEIIDKVRRKNKLYDIKKLVKAINSGEVKQYSWVWFEGVISNLRPTPVFRGGSITDEQLFLLTPMKGDDYCYTFQVKSRGTMVKTEISKEHKDFVNEEYLYEKYYPTIRLNPVLISNTYIDFGDMNGWVENLINEEAINPEVQIMSLSDQIMGRKFYALVKVGKISTSEVQARDEKGELFDETIHFVNLNACAFILTGEIVEWKPIEEDMEEEKGTKTKPKKTKEVKQEKKVEEKKEVTKVKPKKQEWVEKLEQDIKAYLEILPDATFEDMKNDNLFTEYDVPEAAIKKVVEKIKS